ncbi:uncharacterized protein LOC120331418 isoform X2 [Styela clava]
MPIARRTKPSYYTAEDHKTLQILFTKYGHASKVKKSQFWEKVCNDFNAVTSSAKRNPIQIRAYFNDQRQCAVSYPIKSETNNDEIDLQRNQLVLPPPPDEFHLLQSDEEKDTLGSPVKKPKSSTASSSSSSGYLGSSSEHTDEYRSLADDLPKSWEFTEIGTSYLSSTDQGSPMMSPEREEPHIFDDIDDFSMGRTSTFEKSAISSDLVNILSEQARQHHKLKMKLLKDKFRKSSDAHKTKMIMMEKEHEMKKKEHERKMEILMQKYKSIKDGMEE